MSLNTSFPIIFIQSKEGILLLISKFKNVKLFKQDIPSPRCLIPLNSTLHFQKLMAKDLRYESLEIPFPRCSISTSPQPMKSMKRDRLDRLVRLDRAEESSINSLSLIEWLEILIVSSFRFINFPIQEEIELLLERSIYVMSKDKLNPMSVVSFEIPSKSPPGSFPSIHPLLRFRHNLSSLFSFDRFSPRIY